MRRQNQAYASARRRFTVLEASILLACLLSAVAATTRATQASKRPLQPFEKWPYEHLDVASVDQKARAGDAEAQIEMSVRYFAGDAPLAKDPQLAASWMRLAADQGHPYAQEMFGNWHVTGYAGLPMDRSISTKWHIRSAEQGNPASQAYLGLAYQHGLGLLQSSAAAADWFYKAGRGWLRFGKPDLALTNADRIRSLNAPNSFLADKLMNEIYGASADEPKVGPADQQQGASTGTGWIVARGFVVTNHHVIAGRSKLKLIFTDGTTANAEVSGVDPVNDLALLRAVRTAPWPPPLHLASADASPGTRVFAVGYPHPDIMGVEPKLTDGIVSAVTGLRDDVRLLQITVPVQAGNSGGPLMNMRGEVVGIVVAKLNAAAVFKWTGDLPENVNYAIKTAYLRALLGVRGVKTGSATEVTSNPELSQLAKKATASVVMVIAE